jgi:hypothetical protein
VSSFFSVALVLVVVLAGCCVVLLGRRRHLVVASIDFDILSAPFGNSPSPGAPDNGIPEMAARYACPSSQNIISFLHTDEGRAAKILIFWMSEMDDCTSVGRRSTSTGTFTVRTVREVLF